MPMYEYECESCHNQFELHQKFSDAPASECPQCGGPVKKMISATAFSLKGSGWYKEGYCPKTDAAKPAGCAGGGCCGA
jgi:putative FmdB family regulatory protein